MTPRSMRRFGVAISAGALVLGVTAGTALAGEVTGTGKLLHVDGGGKWGTGLHARSACAYSGQEDLQYYTDNGDGTANTTITRGDPGHAQSWGQIPKEIRDFLSTIGLAPGDACNPTIGEPSEP